MVLLVSVNAVLVVFVGVVVVTVGGAGSANGGGSGSSWESRILESRSDETSLMESSSKVSAKGLQINNIFMKEVLKNCSLFTCI